MSDPRSSARATTWPAAMQTIHDQFHRTPSPVKRAALVGKVDRVLTAKTRPELDDAPRSYFPISADVRSRAGHLMFASFTATKQHPNGIDEHRDGLLISAHAGRCDRRGVGHLLIEHTMAYVCHHAIARLHERGVDFSTGDAAALIGFAGILGYLCGLYETHHDGEICLTLGGIILLGVLRPCRRPEPNGTPSKLWFLEVRTALQADAPGCEDRRDRGRIARQVVEKWLLNDYDTTSSLVAAIPFRRADLSDHISQMLLEPA
jgi:hypothetical protein